MIVCSCNVLSDRSVHRALDGGGCAARVSEVYARLGCRAQCGRCAATMRQLMRAAAAARAETCPATFDDVGTIEPVFDEIVLRAAE